MQYCTSPAMGHGLLNSQFCKDIEAYRFRKTAFSAATKTVKYGTATLM